MKRTIAVVVLAAFLFGGAYFLINRGGDAQNVIPTPSTQNEVQTPAQNEQVAPAPAAVGKINIDAVCQGALAYMTFTDGASADAFVAECKEGKHPEVIERYKADMNLGAGAEI